ncbi:MAG: glucan biosynthesis protein [Pseudomonadota bacterium]
MLTRRAAVAAAVSMVGCASLRAQASTEPIAALGPKRQFSFDRLVERARDAAARPHAPTPVAAREVLDKIDYDAHWRIRFREDASFTPPGTIDPVQVFFPGKFFPEPVGIHIVEDGASQEVLFRKSYFTMPDDSAAQDLPDSVGFAGFRVMRPGLAPDWVSFLGASYFRTDGPFAQYGLSARGLAIDTGLASAEEFPRFSNFWLAAPSSEEGILTAYALLESPSVVGAYRFELSRGLSPGENHLTTISARLFFRRGVQRLGIAPLTSMYWYSQRERRHAADWRPEIHDSDGLSLESGSGERLWRPLNNPNVVRTSSFVDNNPRGFGLIQRDRDFAHYQDDGVFYDRRPSAWIEPLGDWGAGAVQLVEIPTVDETFDNIVAYWAPAAPVGPGDVRAFDYRIHWTDQDPKPPGIATVSATWQGQGGVPGQSVLEGVNKMVVDFEGPALEGLSVEDGAEPIVSVSNGEIIGDPSARPIVSAKGWRLIFDVRPTGKEPVEMRAFIRKGNRALTETWIAQIEGLGD